MQKNDAKKKCIAITVDDSVLAEIERRRGLVKRSSYVNELLRTVFHDDILRLDAKGSAKTPASPASDSRFKP